MPKLGHHRADLIVVAVRGLRGVDECRERPVGIEGRLDESLGGSEVVVGEPPQAIAERTDAELTERTRLGVDEIGHGYGISERVNGTRKRNRAPSIGARCGASP